MFRSATIINVVYIAVLYIFKELNNFTYVYYMGICWTTCRPGIGYINSNERFINLYMCFQLLQKILAK